MSSLAQTNLMDVICELRQLGRLLARRAKFFLEPPTDEEVYEALVAHHGLHTELSLRNFSRQFINMFCGNASYFDEVAP